MNLDDETLLDAYLDGELDQARRLAVEDALLAAPSLAHQLQELAQVRQWVVGLPRPTAPADVSASVLIQITEQPPPWFRLLGWKRVATSRSFVLGTSLASAAALLLSLTLARTPSAVPVRPKPIPKTTLVDARTVPSDPWNPPSLTEPTKSSGSIDSKPIPASLPEPQSPPAVVVNLEAERRHQADQERLATLLDRPDVQRIFVVVDSLDGPSRSQVEEALHRSPRRHRDYGRITIAQGLVVDPDRPGEAIVFAMAVDTHERTQLADTLEQSIAGRVIVESGAVPPPVVALLADTGQVDFVDEPTPAESPTVKLPNDSSVITSESPGDHPALSSPSLVSSRNRPLRTEIKGQDAVRAGNGNRARPGRSGHTPSKPFEPDVPPKPMTLLVWLTTRPPSSGSIH
ncbi:MAG: hypothetical protein ABI353_08145 [Isosphaeraceae bacterium]